MTFVLAGFETTAATLMFAVYLLALHPEAQSRLHQELDAGREVIDKKGVIHPTRGKAGAEPAGPVDMNGMTNGTHHPSAPGTGGTNEAGLNNEVIATHFPYACAIIDEALRLFPPGAGPVTSRVPQEDMEVLGYRCGMRFIKWTLVQMGTNDEGIATMLQLTKQQWSMQARS
jgi:cytochrome P450